MNQQTKTTLINGDEYINSTEAAVLCKRARSPSFLRLLAEHKVQTMQISTRRGGMRTLYRKQDVEKVASKIIKTVPKTIENQSDVGTQFQEITEQLAELRQRIQVLEHILGGNTEDTAIVDMVWERIPEQLEMVLDR